MEKIVVSLLQGDTPLFDDLNGAVENHGVFQMNNAATGAGFQMPFHHLSGVVIVCPEIIAHGLFFHVEFVGDTADAAGRQGMLDAAQFLESDVHKPQFW